MWRSRLSSCVAINIVVLSLVKFSIDSSINPKIEHALEFTDLCAIQFRLVVHEVSA